MHPLTCCCQPISKEHTRSLSCVPSTVEEMLYSFSLLSLTISFANSTIEPPIFSPFLWQILLLNGLPKEKKPQISFVNFQDPPLESEYKNKLLFMVKSSVSNFSINPNFLILELMMMLLSVTLLSGSNKVLREHPVFSLQDEQEDKIQKATDFLLN